MPKLRDTDYLYCPARIRALERTLITRERLERMVEARSAEEAAKVLAECGYGEAEGQRIEDLIAAKRGEVYALCTEIAPEPALVDFFRLKYDYHNIKALVKAEAAGEDGDRLLMEEGRVGRRALLDAYRNLQWKELPPVMGQAIAEARELLSRTGDAQLVDFLLDSAYFTELRAIAGASDSEYLKELLALMIDATNLRSAVRGQRLGQSADFMKQVLQPGGHVDTGRLSTAVLSGTSLEEMYTGELQQAAAVSGPVMRGESGQTEFEKLCDNAVQSYLCAAVYVSFGEAPLVSYLAMRENEFTAVRIVMSGRAMGLPTEMIRERLHHV